jgi:hypothetical protein
VITERRKSMQIKKLMGAGVIAIAVISGLAACDSQANTVDANMTKEADEFKIDRRITFVNGITDEYMLVIEGKCSQTNDGSQLEVICKVGDGEYKKHFLGLSDNVTYVSEQVESSNVDPYRYEVVFKPEAILPDIDLQTSADPENEDAK